MPRKFNSPPYPVLRDLLVDAPDRNTVSAVLTIAFDQWKGHKLNDYAFSDLLSKAAERLNSIF